MNSSLSELSAGDINDLSSNISIGESNDSSHSSNFISMWPETHANTYQFLRDAELDAKRYQLERYANEMEKSVLDRELELQAEIREVNSEISELRLEIADQEMELNHIKELRNSEILRIRQHLVEQCRNYEQILSNTEATKSQLITAIEAQRDAHENDKLEMQHTCSDEVDSLDDIIAQLNQQIDDVRKEMFEIQQKNDSDLNDTTMTIDMLSNEMRNIGADGDSVDEEFIQLNKELAGLRRELIIAEETSDSLRRQIDDGARLRAQMRSLLDKGKKQLWETRTRGFGNYE